jgi:hypothetical protein
MSKFIPSFPQIVGILFVLLLVSFARPFVAKVPLLNQI